MNWAIWVEGFARYVSAAKRLTPQTAQSPFVGRIGELLGTGEYDVWWLVTRDRVVREMPPRAEPDPPSGKDEVPAVVRNHLIPMLTPIDTVPKAIDAIESWMAEGMYSAMHWGFDPIHVLLRLAHEEAEGNPRADRGP